MMRKILLALTLASLATPVWAVCPSPLTGKDAAGNPQNFGVTVDAGGNCYGNVGIVDGTNAANKATVSAAGAVKVDASASTQPVSGTLAATQSGTWTVQPGNTANTTAWKVDGSAVTQPVSSATLATAANQATEISSLATIATNTGAAVPAGTARIGYVSDDPCTQLTKTNLAIATSSGTVQLVAPSGSTQVYVCSFSLISAATAVVNLVGGTGATCTTGTPVAALGSTTAASGASLAANGGLTFGNGGATALRTTTAGHGLCLIQSGTTALAGNITFVQQ